jgi:hypothetical protein
MMHSLVWLELAPSTFWLDHATMVEALLVRCWSSTSRISLKAACLGGNVRAVLTPNTEARNTKVGKGYANEKGEGTKA